jgi:hypothetical protein
LLDSHTFVREPSMSRNCTACHGSRVKNEYYGLNEGISSDVHFRARMSCNDCHTGDEMHGVGMTAAHRYDGPANPSCESCHEDQVGIGSGILQHELHGTELVSCQTCHSTTYTNCTNCHVEQTDDSIPFFSVESHDLDFVIGRNVLRSNERPYKYTTLRHVPIDMDSFSFYALELANFDAVPTWAYATPHNIQRNTPQTESCLSCHENDAIFLTEDKVVPIELNANIPVMVEGAPALPEGYVNVITGQEDQTAVTTDETNSDSGGGDDFWGSDGSDSNSEETEDSGDDFWGGSDEDTSQPSDDSAADSFWGGSDDAADEPTDSSSDEGSSDADDFWGSN